VKKAFAIPLFLALASCELVTEIDVPGVPAMLVVNSVFNPNDTVWNVAVSATAHILSGSTLIPKHAVPVLTDENGTQIALTRRILADSMNPAWWVNGGGLMFSTSTMPVAGMIYTLNVTAPGFVPVKASSKVPGEIEFVDAKLDSANLIVEANMYFVTIPVEVTFKDVPGQTDFYYPHMFMENDYAYYDPQIDDTVRGHGVRELYLRKTLNQQDFIEFDEEDVISDATFASNSITIRRFVTLELHVENQDGFQLYFALGHGNEEYHRYFKSALLQRKTSGNPFAQPVQVFSNVEGGLGLFTGYNVSKWDFIK
jgi:hypothetical protein